MGEHTATGSGTSTVAWADLHDYVRTHVQQLIQKLLEDEITELPGRSQSERRTPDEVAGEVDPAYRNGYGKPRQLTTPVGTLTVRRPRVRGLEERFESAIPGALWALFKRRTPEVDELLPELYLHGLAAGDFDQALRAPSGHCWEGRRRSRPARSRA